ncbi:MAG TPA: hypothetical protein VI753_11810 [Anaerolineales bacterium]|nr:hypothetical protein [Anaerolineales bacterium]
MSKLQEINWTIGKAASVVPIVIAIILLTGCLVLAGQGAETEDTAYLTPIPRETLQAYQFGSPVRNKMEAVIAARRSLDNDIYMYYTEQPAVLSVEEMRLEDALKCVTQAGVINTSEERLGDKQVWLVLFEGEWQVIVPSAPGHPVVTPEPPSHECVYIIINQNDSSNSEGGTMECRP